MNTKLKIILIIAAIALTPLLYKVATADYCPIYFNINCIPK